MKLQYGGDRGFRGRHVALLVVAGVAVLAVVGRVSLGDSRQAPMPTTRPAVTAPPITNHPALGRTVGIGPGAADVAFGSGGVWVTCWQCGELVRVDPVTRNVVARVVLVPGAEPHSTWVATGFGSVWVADHLTSSLLRIDPATNQVAEVISLGFAGPVVTGAGAVWVISIQGPDGGSTLARVDPGSGRLTRIPVPGSPTSLAVQGESVWLMGSGSLQRVDVTRNRVVPLDNAYRARAPSEIVAGDGVVWVISDGEVAELDARDGQVLRREPWALNADSFPAGVVTAGALWLQSAEGVARFDPLRGGVTAVVPTGDVEALTAGGGLLWATQGSHVISIDPLRVPARVVVSPGVDAATGVQPAPSRPDPNS